MLASRNYTTRRLQVFLLATQSTMLFTCPFLVARSFARSSYQTVALFAKEHAIFDLCVNTVYSCEGVRMRSKDIYINASTVTCVHMSIHFAESLRFDARTLTKMKFIRLNIVLRRKMLHLTVTE